MIKNPFVKKKEDSGVMSQQDTDTLVAEIHETFFTEVDSLLADAKALGKEKTDNQQLHDKADRLTRLGFTQSSSVEAAQNEVERLKEVKRENIEKKVLAAAINYFSMRYPFYKFITEESVKKICEKYNLVYGEVGNFIGEVPDKNLEAIEKFSIDEKDKVYFRSQSGWGSRNKNIVNWAEYETKHKDYQSDYNYEPAPLEIAGPEEDFDTSDMTVEDSELVQKKVPDPVVLQPILYGKERRIKGYLIVTAWGDEASDPLVVNHKLN